MTAMDSACALSLLERLGTFQLGDKQHVEQIEADRQILQEGKDDLKNAFKESERKQLILEYIGKDRSTWPTVAEKDPNLKFSRQKRTAVKNRFEEVRDNISDILQRAVTEYKKLQDKTEKLQQKVKEFEDRKKIFMSQLSVEPTMAKAAIDKCQKAIERLKSELTKHKQIQTQLEASLDHLKQQLGGYKISNIEKDDLDRARHVLDFLETNTAVKVIETNQNRMTLEFLDKSSNSSDEINSTANLSLTLTLHFSHSCHGNIKLMDVQVNIDHFNIKDIIEVAVANNDVPFLIRTVQERWSRHYPMLSEIEILNRHHAIDWIQNQSQLRVLVGNCGTIMFTLAIPEDYPKSKNITLVDTYGTDHIDLNKLPVEGASLLDWVRHLEKVYS